MTTRSERRHRKNKVKAYAVRVAKMSMIGRLTDTADELIPFFVKKADNLKSCNGECCKGHKHSGWSKGQGKERDRVRKEISEP